MRYEINFTDRPLWLKLRPLELLDSATFSPMSHVQIVLPNVKV